jgi:hypothetical protein
MKQLIFLLRAFSAFAFTNAASVAVTSGYNGEVADAIMTAIKLGNEAIEKGSVYVEPGVTHKLSIPILTTADDVLTESAADPTTFAEAFVWTENTITPADMMFLDKINPRHFEHVWRPFQPVGPLVDKVDNPKIKSAIIEETGKTVGKQLGKLIWQGDTTLIAPNPLRFFNGFITLMSADAGVIKPAPAGVITAANVISILELVESAIPSSIWEDQNVVFHMNTTDYRLYLQAARALDFKGPNIGDAMQERFAGRQIRYYTGLPKNFIVVAKATAGRDSNLWCGVDAESDADNVKIERYRPESENFIVKVLLKMGVNYAISSEVVLYEPA